MLVALVLVALVLVALVLLSLGDDVVGPNLDYLRPRQLYGIPQGPVCVSADQQGLNALTRNKMGVYFYKSYGCICVYCHVRVTNNILLLF